MKKTKIKCFICLLAVMLTLPMFSVTAFARGTDPNAIPAETMLISEEAREPVTGGMEPEGQSLSPEGNATLVDDYYGDKQLITVTTKAGNYFYILIDRANENKETAVHFLNQVDDADLQVLLEDGQEKPVACSCKERCAAGAVKLDCELCAKDMTECAGREPEPEVTEETPVSEEPPKEKSPGVNPAALLVLLAVMGGIGAVFYLKFIKKKPQAKGNHDPDDYDYGEDYEDDEDEEIMETEDEESDADGGGTEELEEEVE